MKKITIALLSLLIIGCANESQSPIIGQWQTKTCEVAPDSLGSHAGEFGKGIYEFTTSGIINIYVQFYTGPACTEEIELVFFEPTNGVFMFTDLGKTTLQEGIEGNILELSFPTGDPEEIFYIITNNEACFSNSLEFNVYNSSYQQSGTSAINFERCLVKQQP